MFWQSKSALTAVCLVAASPVAAAALRIEVAGLRNTNGTVYAAVCTEEEFLRPVCAWFGSAPASAGAVTVTGVPPGTYAAQVVHDENDNRTLDRLGFLPTEGMDFSRDAASGSGPRRGRTPGSS